MTKYGDILDRLKAARSPCREIDAAIATEVLGQYVKRERKRSWRVSDAHDGEYRRLPSYTANIDDAIALTERLMPKCDWHVERWRGDISADIEGYAYGRGATSAINVVIALFLALNQ